MRAHMSLKYEVNGILDNLRVPVRQITFTESHLQNI